MIKRLLLSIIIALFVCNPSLASYSISIGGVGYNLQDHPRLLVTNDDLSTLRTKSGEGGTENVWWAAIKTNSDSFLDSYWNDSTHTWSTEPSLGDIGGYGDYNRAMAVNCALIYMLYPNGSYDGRDYIEYGKAAKALLELHVDNSLYKESCTGDDCYQDDQPWASNPYRDYGSIHLINLALIWDWIYNVDSDALISGDSAFQTKFLSYINDTIIPMTFRHEIIVASPPNGYSECNLAVTKWIGELFIGLTTYEDNEAADGHGFVDGSYTHNSETMVERKFNWYESYLKGLWHKYYQGGHHYDGSHYQIARTSKYALWGIDVLENMQVVSTSEQYSAGIIGSWDKSILDWSLHRTMPLPKNIYIEGRLGEYEWFNAGSGTQGGRLCLDNLYLIDKYPTEPSAKMMHNMINSTFSPAPTTNDPGSVSTLYRYLWFLYWNPNLADTDYTENDTSYNATGVDILISRTGWESTDTVMFFMSSDMVTGNNSDGSTHAGETRFGYNTGSYYLWKGEPLIVDNITSSTQLPYDKPPDHNMLYLGDGTITNGFGATKTTGGTLQMGGTYMTTAQGYSVSEIQYPKADIDYVVVGKDVRYAKTNLNDTYVKPKISNFDRSIVHFTDTAQDYMVVFDNIVENETDLAKYHRVHFTADVTILSNTFSVTGPNSAGQVFGDVVFPSVPTITKTDVTNKADFLPVGLSTEPDIYQVNISQGSPTATECIMIVYKSNTGTSGSATAVNQIDETEMIGCHIEDSVSNKVALFSNDTSYPSSDVSYTISRTVSNVTHNIADLETSTDYYISASDVSSSLSIAISKNDNGGTVINSGDSGTLLFYTNIDNVSLESTEPTTVINQTSGTTVTNSSFQITGTATATTDRTISSITCAGQTVIIDDGAADELGETFTINVTLSEGLNTFTIVTTDSESETDTDVFTVTYNAPISQDSRVTVSGCIVTGVIMK